MRTESPSTLEVFEMRIKDTLAFFCSAVIYLKIIKVK